MAQRITNVSLIGRRTSDENLITSGEPWQGQFWKLMVVLKSDGLIDMQKAILIAANMKFQAGLHVVVG